jgi:16S rRNA (guanine527-N7)-methyltransferase
LVLALLWSDSTWILLDGTLRRTQLLETAVADLDLAGRVEIVFARAEDFGRTAARGTFDLVTARSFGPPAVTAECAAPFLRVGGHLLVSEPPDGTAGRWVGAPLDQLGLEDEGAAGTPAMRCLRQVVPCPDRYPRRPGIPSKRPLWDVPRGTSGP